MVSRLASLCLALVLILAGCTGASPPAIDASGSEVGTTVTTTKSTAETTTTTATTTRSVYATLDAADLSASNRELLRRAAENGSVQVMRTNLTGRLTPDTDGWRVRYRGTLYELSWRYDGFYGKYHLENATEENASAVESDERVVAYENLTDEARRLFDAARAGTESEEYGHDAFPNQLRDNDYVKHDGEYYALEVVVGDYIVYRLSLAPVES